MKAHRAIFPVAVLVTALGLLVGMQPLFAQDVGDRVRVTTDDHSRVIGRILAVRSDGFDVGLSEGRSDSFARANIVRMERSILRLSLGGALVAGGCAGGLALPASIWLLNGLGCGSSWGRACDGVRPGAYLASAAVGVVLGGLTGLVLYSLDRLEWWETIEVDGEDTALRPMINLRLDRGHNAVIVGLRRSF